MGATRPFRGVMRALHALLPVALLVAFAHANAATAPNWVRIPLQKVGRSAEHARARQLGATAATISSDVARDVRLAYQIERVRRRTRTAEEDGGSSEGDAEGSGLLDGAESLLEYAKANATGKMPVVYSEVPLGIGFGTHYAELYLGVPAQRASVIVDTGSHLTALPCSSCKDCGDHTDPYFDITKSTTAKFATCRAEVQCNSCSEDRCYISQSYTEGSMWQAVVVDELVWVGGFAGTDADFIMQHYGVRFPLGCQTKETGLFITQKENGIMGLGRHKATVMSYMLDARRIEKNIFSLCFGANGGDMVLGGVDFSHHSTDVAYTPLITDNSGWYPVKVKDIWVAGKSLGIDPTSLNSGKGVIVDSGTTDTFFVRSSSRAFLSAFESAAGIKYSEDKMVIRAEDLASLPNITIVLEGMTPTDDDIELSIPAEKYLTLSDDGKYYYGNFHFSERSGGVLGASTMMGYDVVFDTENKRIGFAESKCGDGAHSPVAASPGAGASGATTQASENPVDSLHYGTFFVQIVVISVLGIVLVAFVWQRMKKRSWYAVPGADALGTPQEGGDDDDIFSEDDEDAHDPPDSATSSAARVRSPPRRQVPSPKFTIGSDDEDELSPPRGSVSISMGGVVADRQRQEYI